MGRKNEMKFKVIVLVWMHKKVTKYQNVKLYEDNERHTIN